MEKVYLYDTTLRDGTQGEGVSLSVEDKLKIALKLDKLGANYIEGGWPGSNPKDMEFFNRAKDLELENAVITAFGSTRRPNVKVDEDNNLKALVEAGVKACALVGKSWDFHVEAALNTTLEENLDMIYSSIKYLKEKGLEVIFDAEHFFDGYQKNPQYAMKTLEAAQRAGVDWIALCDTNGGTLPHTIQDIISTVVEEIDVPVGIHAHNDGDMAVANTVIAVEAGARQVQGTINGFGERCGNANLCSIIPNLQLKGNYQVVTLEQLGMLTEVSRYVNEIANVVPPTNQPFVGYSAFAHKGGIHVSALLKNPKTYEHLEPELVGNKRRVLVSELSGYSNLRYKAEELNLDVDLDAPETKKVIQEIKELEHQGYQFEGAEGSLELLLMKAKGEIDELFKLVSFKIMLEKQSDNGIISEAIVKLEVNGEIVHTAAEGNGPVNALDNALRKSLEQFYPQLAQMYLADYKVRVLEEKDGTEAKVRVLIETKDKHRNWSTVGVSANIIEASWQALADSMKYGLLKK
ncbi:2-isopropylmalate synthase [Desulfitispora alkaliphila]|uniref:citramalate synthase n=1 Tax=Desulfitispora alkaliphila TaxID=622674 RepID=UPI003D1D62C8